MKPPGSGHMDREDGDGDADEDGAAAEAEAGAAQGLKHYSPSPSSSSPGREFSFIISMNAPEKIPDEERPSSPLAVDLSPADEIFFHGHLLPLHLLSQLPVHRDSFNLPIQGIESSSSSIREDKCSSANTSSRRIIDDERGDRGKSKSFSLPRSRKVDYSQESKKRRLRFDVLKWYAGYLKPFLVSFTNKGGGGGGKSSYPQSTAPPPQPPPPPQQPFSLSSGNLRLKKKEVRGLRGEASAPASMKSSPSNSGYFVPSGNSTPMGKNDSTMEELQAAIQAAIAHCKKSIAEEKSNHQLNTSK